MNKKEWILFSGLWSIPIGIVLAFLYGVQVTSWRGIVEYGFAAGKKGELVLTDYPKMLLIVMIPPVAVFLSNIKKKKDGNDDFSPLSVFSKSPIKKSYAQKKAMHPSVDREYITQFPGVGTVGKMGRKYITIPFDPWKVQHTLVIGGPGSKKTTTIATTLLSLKNNKQKIAIFATDIKPELARRFSDMRTIEAVNFASRNEVYFGWDMYYGISENSSDDQLIKRMRMISNCLIIDQPDEKNSHFTNNARNILAAYLFGCYRILHLEFIDAIRKLAMVDLEQNIQQLTETNEKASYAFKLKEMLGIYSGKKSEGFEDVKTTLTTNLYCFSLDSVRYALKDNPLKACPADLTSKNPKSVFLCVPDGDLQTLAPLYACCVEMTLRHLMDSPEAERSDGNVIPIWFLLDEVGNLPRIPSLERACALLRSRRCYIWLVVQSLSQLCNTYSENVTNAIIEDCETVLVLSAKDERTCKTIQSWCGHYREPKVTVTSQTFFGLTPSTSQGEEFRNIYDVSDIRSLRKQDSLLIFTDGAWFRGKKFTYRDDPELLELSEYLTEANDRLIESGKRGF